MTKESILAKILRYLIYAAAFTPLIIFSQFMSPFHFGKVVVFRSLVEIMVVFYLLLIWRDWSYLQKTNKIFWAFLLFTLAFTVTTITSIQPYQSFWGTLERMGGLWAFWHYFAFFVVLTSVLKTKQHWFVFLKLIIAAGILSAIYGFGQKTDIKFFIGSGNRMRIFGTLGNPALFAGYQLLVLFLSLTLFFVGGNTKREKYFFGSAVLLTALAIMLTVVRGSILALGIGFLLFTFLYWRQFKSAGALKILLVLLLLATVTVASAFIFKNTAFVKNSNYLSKISSLSFGDATVKTRLWALRAGFEGWDETPRTVLVGWGPENFNIPFSKHFNPKFFKGPGSETLFDRAHNMFVEILVTMGLTGFFAYILLFLAMAQTLKKIKKLPNSAVYSIGFISLMVVYVIHNSFIFDTSGNFIVFFGILGFVSALPSLLEPPAGNNKPAVQPAGQRGLGSLYSFSAVVLFIAVSALIYKTNILPAKANYTTTRAIIIGWSGDFNGAVKKYQEAVAYDVPGKYEIRHRFGQYLLERGVSASPEALQIVIDAIQKNADENPLDYLPQLYLARLNILLGRAQPDSPYTDEQLKHSTRALELSPTFVRTYYEVAQAYLNKKDIATASEYFKKALDLNPDVGLSWWYWGVVEYDRGNVKAGLNAVEQAVNKGFTIAESDYLRLIAIYLKQNDYQKIIWAQEKLVALKPNNAQYHASLAAAYVKVGRIDDAVKEAREAARLDKMFEAEARSFIRSLGREF